MEPKTGLDSLPSWRPYAAASLIALIGSGCVGGLDLDGFETTAGADGGAEDGAASGSPGGDGGNGSGTTTNGDGSTSTNGDGGTSTDDDGGTSTNGDGGNSGSGGNDSGGGNSGGDSGTHTGVPDDQVPVFVAQGRGGRLVFSCDAGRTWGNEQVIDGSDADHAPYAAQGMAYGEGRLVTLWGWGSTAKVRYTEDGSDWTELDIYMHGQSDVMYVGDMFVAGGGHVGQTSSDGTAWNAIVLHVEESSPSIIRGYAAGPYSGGQAIVGAGDGRFVYSHDDGATWPAGSGPSGCAMGIFPDSGGIEAMGDNFYVVSGSGQACRSSDGGVTWQGPVNVGGAVTELVVADGTLYAYAGSQVFTSTDGEDWTAHSLTPSSGIVNVGYAANGPDAGTFAAANWDGSVFYHSNDGITWTQATGGSAGTTMTQVAAAYLDPGGVCD